MAVFSLGRKLFNNKATAKAAVRAILNSNPINHHLTGEDFDLVLAAVRRHPGREEKLGGGVAGIVIRNVEYRRGIMQRCFHVIRDDGTEIDFSYLRCFGVGHSHYREAARAAVAPIVHAYKMERFAGRGAMPCDITGDLLTFDDASVDHAPPWPFSRIAKEYEGFYGEPETVDEGLRRVFVKPEDVARFVTFHNDRAVLRILSKRLNMSLGDHGGHALEDAA